MNCLICSQPFMLSPSWRSLLFNDLEPVICESCEETFEPITGPVCPHCGASSDGLCRDCAAWEKTEYAELLSGGRSLYTYNEAMKSYLHQYKFLQDVALSHVFAEPIQKALKGKTLIPVPLTDEKVKERTFPQVERLLDAARLPYIQCLVKTGSTQGTKSRQERLNAAPLFEWNGKPVPKTLVIVDDLYTTGTTLRHAARALKAAGAEEVSVFTLIRG